eukprot:5191625-Ditylum_brightwellii.AAC.1
MCIRDSSMNDSSIAVGDVVRAFHSASAGWQEATVVTTGVDFDGRFFLVQWHASEELEGPGEAIITLEHIAPHSFTGAVTIVA